MKPGECGIPDDWPSDDPRPCPECGATVSGNDPVNGVCQTIAVGREARRLSAALTAATARIAELERVLKVCDGALENAANALEEVAELTWDKRQPDATRNACEQASLLASEECDKARAARATIAEAG